MLIQLNKIIHIIFINNELLLIMDKNDYYNFDPSGIRYFPSPGQSLLQYSCCFMHEFVLFHYNMPSPISF